MMNVECRSTLSPLQVTKNLASINDIIVLAKDIMTIPKAKSSALRSCIGSLEDAWHMMPPLEATSELGGMA